MDTNARAAPDPPEHGDSTTLLRPMMLMNNASTITARTVVVLEPVPFPPRATIRHSKPPANPHAMTRGHAGHFVRYWRRMPHAARFSGPRKGLDSALVLSNSEPVRFRGSIGNEGTPGVRPVLQCCG